MDRVQPSIRVLDDDQRAGVHRRSLEILATVGIRVDSKRARELFAAAGCSAVSDGRVSIPAELVERMVREAPASVDIYDRRGRLSFTVGRPPRHPTRFGIGVTNLYYDDPRTQQIEPFAASHLGDCVRLANELGAFDLVATPGIPHDEPPQRADLVATLQMAANTVKPLVVLVSNPELFEPVLDLLAQLGPQAGDRPFAVPYLNPITPLVINEDTVNKMEVALNRGLPIIYNSYGMAGATMPITAGAGLAMLNAELLAGLVLAQLIRPRSAVILGMLPAGFDMKNMVSVFTPHTMLLNLACAEMMAFYDLPHSGTSGSGAGWGADLSAAGGFWLNHLTACLGKVGMAPFVGGNFDSKVFCPQAVVYANDVIEQAQRFAGGFTLEPGQVIVEELKEVGPGGDFLGSRRTFELFRSMAFESSIWPNLSLEQWRQRQQPSAARMLRERTLELVEKASIPEDHDDVLERGRAFIAQRGI